MEKISKADKEQLNRIMSGLKCDLEEAKEILAYDKAIDKAGAKERLAHDLDLETEKEAKKMANVRDHKAPNYQFTKRERKANPTKGGIIAELAKFMENDSEFAVADLEITNKERVIAFTIGEDKFEITLTQKRKKKI